MRVVFMGTPEFAVPTLQALLDAGHEVASSYRSQIDPWGGAAASRRPPSLSLPTSVASRFSSLAASARPRFSSASPMPRPRPSSWPPTLACSLPLSWCYPRSAA